LLELSSSASPERQNTFVAAERKRTRNMVPSAQQENMPDNLSLLLDAVVFE